MYTDNDSIMTILKELKSAPFLCLEYEIKELADLFDHQQLECVSQRE